MSDITAKYIKCRQLLMKAMLAAVMRNQHLTKIVMDQAIEAEILKVTYEENEEGDIETNLSEVMLPGEEEGN